MKNKITELFGIKYPLIQAGMIWCSGWELAAAVSNAGGLGIIGSGSMYPEILEDQIIKCKANTNNPFAVNLPMLYPDIDKHIETIIKHKVPIVFTSAGNPKTWTNYLHENGIKVAHVEAGGHNGRDETTTFCLIPKVANEIKIPLIAAGGIGTGRGMLAALNLGADGVQIGSRFVATVESSAHVNFKRRIINLPEGDTILTLKEITPVRLIKNEFYGKLEVAYAQNANEEQLKEILGRGRAKKGMFEGDLVEGELEIGQVATLIKSIQPAAEVVNEIILEFRNALLEQANDKFNF
jgi:enoyl-[acyl-carrier protein] reductase II